MYSVSNDFNISIKAVARQMDCRFTINEVDNLHNLVSINIDRRNQNGNNLVGNAIPQNAKIVLNNFPSDYNFLNNIINISFGCLVNGTYEYVPMPTYYVESAEFNQENKQWTLNAYDGLYNLNNFSVDEVLSVGENPLTYPCTRLDYLKAICTLTKDTISEITLATENFFGNDIILKSAPNYNGNESVLSPVSSIAEAGLCNAYIGRDNKLYLKQITEPTYTYNSELNTGKYYFAIGNVNVCFELTEAIESFEYNPLTRLINDSIPIYYLESENLTGHTLISGLIYNNNIASDFNLTSVENDTQRANYSSANIKSHYGKVNTVVLSRGDVEDNIYIKDDLSVEENGNTEFTIINNPFIDYGSETDYRYDLIADIFCVMNNFECNAYILNFRGNPALDCYDYISFLDCYDKTKEHTEIFVGDKITYKTRGYQSSTELQAISQSQIDKTKALTIRDLYNNTQIIVDKVNQQINMIISSVDEVNNSLTLLENTVESNKEQTDIKISMTGGNNLLKNSAFFKGTDFWTLGENTNLNILQDTNATDNTESGSIVNLKHGSISQSFNTAIKEFYTFSCLVKNLKTVSNSNSYIRIYRSDNDYVEIYSNEQYNNLTQINYQYEASVNMPKLVIYTDNNSADFEIADLRVVRGNSPQNWSQNADEIYGKGILIDNTGVEVRSLSGEPTTSSLDNDSLLIKNGNTVITEVSDEQIIANKIISNTTLQIGSVVIDEIEAGRLFIYRGN